MDLNEETAEILGAFIGDGWIQSDEKSFYIAGHMKDDKDYYTYLSTIISKNVVVVKPKNYIYWSVRGVGIHKKEIIKELLNFGFQKGKKCYSAKIPEKIMNSSSSKIKKATLRGIFDTDGCFSCEKSNSKNSVLWKRTHKYVPMITISSCSKDLLLQINLLLEELNILPVISHRDKKGFYNGRNRSDFYVLRIRKKEDVISWFEKIGSNNPKHINKYKIWRNIGYLP